MRLSLPYIGSLPRAGVASHAVHTALALALLFAAALPLLWLSLTATPTIHLEIGEWGDAPYLQAVNEPEKNASETFRWTGAQTVLTLPNLGSSYQLLRVRAHGWRPPGNHSPRVQIMASGQALATIQTTPELHTYEILLPPGNASPILTVQFDSELGRIPNDRRDLGFAIDWIELVQLDPRAAPSPWQFGGQALLLLLLLALVLALALPRAWAIGAGATLTWALLGANARQPLWVSTALGGWLIVAVLLLAATWLVRPRLARLLAPWMSPAQARLAWALFVAALALRLLGAIHPLFEIHDLGFHRGWLGDVTQGQLYIYSTPSEFQNRPVFNPPAGYLLVLPLRLLGLPSHLVVQAGLALVDALGALLLLVLGRELGLSGRATLLALALYTALPINMTMLWWGFTTNALAQAAGLLLFWLLLRLARAPTEGRQAAFAAALGAAVLMHIGALVLVVALVGACVVLGWPRLHPVSRRAIIGAALLVGACAGLIYFSAVVNSILVPSANAGRPSLPQTLANNWAVRGEKLGLISTGLLRGFLPLPLALAPLAFVHALRLRLRRPLGWALLAGWLAVCLLFFGVYMGLGLVVRYLYFAAPLVCLVLGALLSSLWRRRGRWVVLALVLLVAWSGTALWAAGVLVNVKPSGAPLTY